jgi:hypothetical protein
MRSTSRLAAAAAVALGAAGFATAASAQLLGGSVQLGATRSPVVAPVCPPNVSSSACTIILTRVTALETVRDGVAYPTRVQQAGRITDFTVGLSQLSANKATQASYISYLDSTYGGTTQVGITVLKPGVGPRARNRWRVVGQSPMFHVQPYLGSVVQIPLDNTIPVKPGDVIALTTPTWAPVLTIGVNSKEFAYRQSRLFNCANPPRTSQAQLTWGESTTYNCNYPGTRLEYSATEDRYPLGVPPS